MKRFRKRWNTMECAAYTLARQRMTSLIGMGMFLGALFLGISCDDDPSSPCPIYEVGALEGYVLAGGEGVAVPVGARLVEGENRGESLYETISDSTGWYRLELPTGIYWIETNPSRATVYTSDMSDTVHVTARTRQLDILRGKVVAQIAVPESLNGRRFRVRLDGENRFNYSAVAYAEDGLLELLFPIVVPGPYRLCLSLPMPRIWLPGTYDPARADTLIISADQLTLYTASLNNYASIRGTVEGSWQEAYAFCPRVEAYGTDSSRVGRVGVESDGSFVLDLFVAQSVKLRIDYPSDIEQWIGGDSYETATIYDLQPGDHLTGVSAIESGLLCTLEGPGYFINHRTRFLLRDETGREYRPSHEFFNNPLAICGLPAGRYYLFVFGYCSDQTWASQWYNGADSLAEATLIDLGEGELVPITVHLVEGGRIEGSLYEPDGQPATGARVRIYNSIGLPLCEYEHYCHEGTFSITGLPNGDYYLVSEKWDRAPCWYPGVAEQDSAQVIEIRDYATITGIEWTLLAK
ncbi:MAG: hypothetical protein KAY24_04595 [Candidatus Eisenbacteria sp.]|nr:hypothetical protein [Candidatus Eisenbacteria bacterium]